MKISVGCVVVALLAVAGIAASHNRPPRQRRQRMTTRHRSHQHKYATYFDDWSDAQDKEVKLQALVSEAVKPGPRSLSAPPPNSSALSPPGCAPLPFNVLMMQFLQEGELNPNYVATTKEEAALFPNMNWPEKEVSSYRRMLNKVKRKLFRLALGNVALLLHFKRLLKGRLHISTRRRSTRRRRRRAGPRIRNTISRLSRRQRKQSKPVRQSDGSAALTTTRQCYSAGSLVSPTTLRTCESCGATTVLPPTSFPRYLNEIVCGSSATAPSCFQGYGRCVQKYFTMKLLRHTGNCVPVSQGGATVLMEEWVPYYQQIRTCCECEIYDNTLLSMLL